MLIGLLGLALAGPVPMNPATARSLVASCGDHLSPEDGQSFTLSEPGKPWHQHGFAVTLLNGLCVVHAAPSHPPEVLSGAWFSCMNCSADQVAGVSFHDINGDGTPDLTVAVDGTAGWDPQEISGSRYIGGRRFYVWISDASFSTLTRMPQDKVDALKAKDLRSLRLALKKLPTVEGASQR